MYGYVKQILVIGSVRVNVFLDLHKYEKLARHCYYVERVFKNLKIIVRGNYQVNIT